jgi:hypothetical protein
MKSYADHLATRSSSPAAKANTLKPVLRSSAIFPVRHDAQCQSRVSFMGYWLLKRGIPELGLLVTLRDAGGAVILRDLEQITTADARRIELGALLARVYGEKGPESFEGSVELEVISPRSLIFPYPAFVLEYFGEGFNGAVHTTGRVYNDFEDLQENSESQVAESGFDVWPGAGRHPFFAFTNGPIPNPAPTVAWILTSASGRQTCGTFVLPPLSAYATRFVMLDDHVDLTPLGEEPGSISLLHNFSGFFPRFVAGTFQEEPKTVSITHTYYDCSPMNRGRDYWEPQDPLYHDASLFCPLFLDGDTRTETVLYPIFSPSRFGVGLHFHDTSGRLLLSLPGFMKLDTTEGRLIRIDHGAILRQHGVRDATGVLITAERETGGVLPSRLKTGFNVRGGGPGDLGCNICCNLAPFHGPAPATPPTFTDKTRPFRWLPILNHGRSVVVIANVSGEKAYRRSAHVRVSLYREGHEAPLEWEVSLPPFGQVRIDTGVDAQIVRFLDGRSGWVVFRPDHAGVVGYYFDFHPRAIAGDHGF